MPKMRFLFDTGTGLYHRELGHTFHIFISNKNSIIDTPINTFLITFCNTITDVYKTLQNCNVLQLILSIYFTILPIVLFCVFVCLFVFLIGFF